MNYRQEFTKIVVNQALLKRLSPADALEEVVWNGEKVARPDSLIAVASKWFLQSPDLIRERVYGAIAKKIHLENRRMGLGTPKNW